MFTIKYGRSANAGQTLLKEFWSGPMDFLFSKNALILVVVGFFAGSLGCDYYHKATPMNFQLSKVQFVSAFPAKKEGDTVVRKCLAGDEADGMVVHLNMLSLTGAEAQQDLSIRPGDAVKVKGSSQRCVVADKGGPRSFMDTCELGENSVSILGDCIERYPDADLANATYKCEDLMLASCTCQGECPPGCTSGAGGCECPPGECPSPCAREGRGLSAEDFRYSAYLASEDGDYGFTRDAKVGRLGVAVLIDMSGSTKGFVDQKGLEVQTANLIEGKGSDPGVARVTAVKQFLTSLDDSDKTIVFVFGEYPLDKTQAVTKAKVLCFDAKGNTPEEELRKRCFSTDRSLVLSKHVVGSNTEEAELDKLQKLPEQGSRAPLWSAVRDVYEFMRDKADTDVRHIIVIDDGPDTCDPSSPYFIPYIGNTPQVSCGDGTTFTQFREEVQNDIGQAGKSKVAISFIQFQSFGYKDRDPRQMEIACLTGGHYMFLNTLEPNRLQQTELEDAFKDAILKLRYALIGSWSLYFKLPKEFYGLDKGNIYSFRGEIKLRDDVQGTITKLSEVLHLDVGMISSQGVQLPLDLRPAIRLSCEGDANCDWFTEPAPACRKVGCGADTAVCEWVKLGDNTSCGDTKVCCNGYCSPGCKLK